MKKWILTLSLMSGMAVVAMPSFADDKSDIKGLYTKLCASMKAKDSSGLMKCGTKEFTMTEKGGKPMKAAEISAALQQQFAMVKNVDTCTAEIASLTISGKKAMVKSKMHTVMSLLMGKDKVGKMDATDVSNDVLVKTADGWKFSSVTSVDRKMTLNGKPFNPMAMAAPPSAGKK